MDLNFNDLCSVLQERAEEYEVSGHEDIFQVLERAATELRRINHENHGEVCPTKTTNEGSVDPRLSMNLRELATFLDEESKRYEGSGHREIYVVLKTTQGELSAIAARMGLSSEEFPPISGPAGRG